MTRGIVVLSVIICVLLLGAGAYYLVYPRFFSPIYVWEVNIPREGQSASTSKLTSPEGVVYWENWEETLLTAPNLSFGRQIGRTSDGMRIHEIPGDAAHDDITLTGFMFPAIVFERE